MNPLTEAAACIIIGCLFPLIVVAIIGLMVAEGVLCATESA